jgi:hypothetical protein
MKKLLLFSLLSISFVLFSADDGRRIGPASASATDCATTHDLFLKRLTQYKKAHYKYTVQGKPKAQIAEEIKQFIQENTRGHYMMTLTRIGYSPNPQSIDEVIHNYKQDDESAIDQTMLGPDREITADDKQFLKALIGDDNTKNIRNTYKWLNDTAPVWIWRQNQRADQKVEAVVRFYADSDGFNFDCYWSPLMEGRSFGVRCR